MRLLIIFCVVAISLPIKSFSNDFMPTNEYPDNPSSIYKIGNNGFTVFDKRTGLEWTRCGLQQKWDGKSCSTSTSAVEIKDIPAFVDQFRQQHGSEWRLPTIDELITLLEFKCTGQTAVNSEIFPNFAHALWSSSETIPISREKTTLYSLSFRCVQPIIHKGGSMSPTIYLVR